MEIILTLALFSGYLAFMRNNPIWTYDTLAPWAMIVFMLVLLALGIKKFGWEFKPFDKVDLNNGAVGPMEKDEAVHDNWLRKIYQWVVERVLVL